MIGISIRSDGFGFVSDDPHGHRRPLDADTVATLQGYSEQYARHLAEVDPAPGLRALGLDLFRFLDGGAGELSALVERAQPALCFEITSSTARPSQAALALLCAPWELLANERGFLAANDVLGLRVVRRFGHRDARRVSLATARDPGEAPPRFARHLPPAKRAIDGGAALAPRHRAVLELLATGRSEKQVAATLQLSPRTAHKYIEQIYRALNVSSRAELMALFIVR